ncbi:MAG TPA: glycosyltransferase family 39 protein [Chloroflexota bacterium]|nr:glycosyltransferase family 39 protein [Chloroflexota bacterium]
MSLPLSEGIDRAVIGLPFSLPSPSRGRTAIALACAGLVPLGVLLMQQTYVVSWIPMPPSRILDQAFPNPEWVIYGTLLALLGCLGVFFFLPPLLVVTNEAPTEDTGLRFRGRPSPIALVVIACALGLYVWVIAAAHAHTANPWLLLPFLVAIVLAGLAIRTLMEPAALDPLPRWAPIEYLFVTAAVLSFTAFNLYDLRDWHFIFWGDEWPFYDLAGAVAHGVAVDPFSQAGVYGIHPLADSIYQGLVMRLVDMHALGWRLSSTLAAALPMIPLYALGRRLLGPLHAAAAVIIYGACPLLWAFARIGYNNNDPLFLMALSAALGYAGMRRDSAVLLFAAGACAGGGWYSLFSGRLMIGVVCLAVLLDWPGGRRLVARRLAFLLLGFVLVALPLVVNNGDQTIRQMFPLISLSQARTTGPVSNLLAQNTVRGVYAFLYATEDTHYVYGEVFDVLSAGALCVGVTLALRQARHGGARLIVIWFVVGLLLTTPLYYVPQIADTRLMIAVAPAALLAAWGLGGVLDALRRFSPWAGGLMASVGMAGALTAILGLNLHQFYVTIIASPAPPYPTADLIAGLLLDTPDTVFLLPADMSRIDPNMALCDIVHGYRVDPARVFYPYPSGLGPYCAGGIAVLPRPLPNVLVLRDSQGANPACAGLASVRLSSEGGAVWGYSVPMPLLPPVAYFEALKARVGAACPHLSG